MKFRKKPVVIEAMQFVGESNVDEVLEWVTRESPQSAVGTSKEIYIPTLEGEMTASVGDWIIKGVKGEFYPCKPDIFEATYEAVNE